MGKSLSVFYSVAVLADRGGGERPERREIRLIEGNANCRHLKKMTCKGTLRQVLSV
jgi:hypothetical protein